jgi:PAS domain S-box-containing protein
MSKAPSQHRKVSIKTKLTLTVLVTVSLVMIAVSWNLYRYVHSMMSRSIMSQQSILVTEIAAQLNGRIELARHQLMLATTDISVQSLKNPGALQHILTQSSPVQMIFDAGFLVIGTNGRVITESMGFPELIGTDLRHRDYVSEPLRTGKPYLSAPFRLSIPPNTPLIAMSVPVRDNRDNIICLLAGYHSLGTDQFLTNLSSQSFGAGSYLYLLQGRTILMHPDSSRILESIPEGKNPGIDAALKGFEGSLENTNSKGQHMLSSFKQVGQTGWVLGANTPYDEAFKPLQKLAVNAVALSTFGIILALLAVWYVTRRLTLPIHQLTAHVDAARLDSQNWLPIQLSTGDEIEHLADTYNSMMKEVHDTKQLLKNERDFFSGIIQSSAAPMFVIDRNHKILFWNNALAKLTGKSSFQMTGTKQQWTPFYKTKRPVLADLVIDHSLDHIDDLYSNHSSSLFIEGSLRAEGWYENLAGKRRYIFFEAAPIKNSSNEIIAAVETLEDITDRKLAEEATSAHNLFLQKIVDAIPNPIFYKDINGIYLGCNIAFKSFFGKTGEQIIGRTLQDILPEEYTRQSILKDRSIFETGDSLRYETELVQGDENVRNVLVSKAPFTHPDGSLAGIVGAFVDITNQQQMDDQIRKMSRAIEQSPATIVITNTRGIIEYVNPKFCQTTGYTAEDAIGQNPRVLKSGEMPVDGYAELWTTISSGKEWRGEFHNKRKDGTLFWEFASISPLTDKQGKITGYLAIKEDITERKRVEEALGASEKRLSHIVNAAQDAIIMLDPDGSISMWNDSAARIFGYTASEAVGKNMHHLIAPKRYHADHFPAFEKFRETGDGAAVGQLIELYALRSDGEEFSVELALSKVQINDQWHAIGVIRDITSRKKSEEALAAASKELEANHAKLEQLFDQVAAAKREWEQTLDHLRDFVILTDAGHRIRRYNKLLSDATGRPINELVGSNWRDLITEAGFHFVTFNGTSGEIFHQRSGRSYDIIIYAIEENDIVTGHVVSINDTTDLRATTQELEKAYAELKEAQLQIFQQEKMASIGQLAAGVAHEINNPMGFISSNLGTLNKYVDRLAEFIGAADQSLVSCAGSLEAEKLKEIRKRLKVDYIIDDSRQLIAESQDGAGRVRRIVQDLKSFSRVDQTECALIDLNEALETTINIAWNEIKYVATLNREFGDIPQIKCFPQQLNQVFLNLLVNAAHAIGENQGTITVRTWSEGEKVLVSVTDSGCGIPEEIRQRIFEPFFTTKEVGKGTGLGLSISYDIIRKHGGEIAVESKIGHGSTFIVRLPVNGPDEELAAGAQRGGE